MKKNPVDNAGSTIESFLLIRLINHPSDAVKNGIAPTYIPQIC